MYAVKITEKAAEMMPALSVFVDAVALVGKDQAKALVEEYGCEWVEEPPSINWGIPVTQDAETGEGGGPDGPQT